MMMLSPLALQKYTYPSLISFEPMPWREEETMSTLPRGKKTWQSWVGHAPCLMLSVSEFLSGYWFLLVRVYPFFPHVAGINGVKSSNR
ncbi:hypothetical protein QN277_001927 [Acacia crassicarpa]|uniref:Uncharacterized protein n=1 Tax=Acacia crassicarpa TaxID=499986 RepID=A0AAE1THC4_9FABA|nr:hypothetical protein QN277_001927 [Acacia crassicarpa]